MLVRDSVDEERGEDWFILSQRSRDPIETLKRAFEDLHFGLLLQRVEHLDNPFKEKQITPEVREHRGTLVKTFYVSLHCRLFLPFEGRFHYNNILNQSLNSFLHDHPSLTVG